MKTNFSRIAASAFVFAALISPLSAQVTDTKNLKNAAHEGKEVLQETAEQIERGTVLRSAVDSQIIGTQAMFEANLKAKKNIVDMKPNTFLAMWNNPAFAVQFEKYLSAPAETSEDYKVYRERMSKIMELLAPGRATKANQDEAFNLLTKASEFESDANICTTIHDAVYAAANVRVLVKNLTEANQDYEKQLKASQYNQLHSALSLTLPALAPSKNDVGVYNNQQKELQTAIMDPSKSEVASLKQTIQRNHTQITTAEVQAKFQMQALILQLFVQRRYQHVIILNRFYRALFDDGDQSLEQFNQMADKMGYNKAAGQAKVSDIKGENKGGVGNGVGAGVNTGNQQNNNNQGGAGSGLGVSSFLASDVSFNVDNLSMESAQNALTTAMRGASRTFKSLSQIDSVANEIIRDVNEGVKVYKFLLDKEEMESACSQLAAVFVKGEYLPSVRLLSQDDKRKTLAYAQLCNRLINAANSGNIDILTDVVDKIKKMNPGFDDAEIHARLQGVKTASSLLVANARVAASKGDLQTVQTQITRAAALWPNNPELQSFSSDISKMSEKASPMVQALSDFDQLEGQGNYRRIFDEKEKYIAAVAADDTSKKTVRQAKLRSVLDRMQEIETSIMRAQEISRRGDQSGAWEGLEVTFQKYPDDLKLGQLRAELTTQTPDFVNDIRQAKELEARKQYGSALAWYLRAQGRYPMSDLTKQGIQRVVRDLIPDAN